MGYFFFGVPQLPERGGRDEAHQEAQDRENDEKLEKGVTMLAPPPRGPLFGHRNIEHSGAEGAAGSDTAADGRLRRTYPSDHAAPRVRGTGGSALCQSVRRFAAG